jgi:hypothetical protein
VQLCVLPLFTDVSIRGIRRNYICVTRLVYKDAVGVCMGPGLDMVAQVMFELGFSLVQMIVIRHFRTFWVFLGHSVFTERIVVRILCS